MDQESGHLRRLYPLRTVRLWIAGAISFLVLTVLFFTWGFSDAHGLINIFTAFVRFSLNDSPVDGRAPAIKEEV